MLVVNTVQLDQVVREFCAADAYGVDTEFHAEGTYFPRLALIQLAVPGRVVLIDPTRVDPRGLQPLVAGPGVADPIPASAKAGAVRPSAPLQSGSPAGRPPWASTATP